MADLAHDVREIGSETHTDEDPEPITSQADADRALKFANLLAEYLFVLPAQIAQARQLGVEQKKPPGTSVSPGRKTKPELVRRRISSSLRFIPRDDAHERASEHVAAFLAATWSARSRRQ
jgi:hypothetical protein